MSHAKINTQIQNKAARTLEEQLKQVAAALVAAQRKTAGGAS